MTRHAFRGPFPGFLTVSFLLPLTGTLLVLQAAYDSPVLWVLFVVVGLAVFAVEVVTAVSAVREGAVSAADAARLGELEPLPPIAGDEGGRR
jgi:hypothetical protein